MHPFLPLFAWLIQLGVCQPTQFTPRNAGPGVVVVVCPLVLPPPAVTVPEEKEEESAQPGNSNSPRRYRHTGG